MNILARVKSVQPSPSLPPARTLTSGTNHNQWWRIDCFLSSYFLHWGEKNTLHFTVYYLLYYFSSTFGDRVRKYLEKSAWLIVGNALNVMSIFVFFICLILLFCGQGLFQVQWLCLLCCSLFCYSLIICCSNQGMWLYLSLFLSFSTFIFQFITVYIIYYMYYR